MILQFWQWVSIKPCKNAFGFERVSHTDRKEKHGEKTARHSRKTQPVNLDAVLRFSGKVLALYLLAEKEVVAAH